MTTNFYQGRPTILRTRYAQIATCCFLVAYGLLMVLFAEYYRSTAYYQAFLIARPTTWGWCFFTVGVLGLGALLGPRPYTWRHHLEVFAAVCASVRIFLMLFWTLLLFVSILTQEARGTVGGPLIWVLVASVDFSSVVRFGTGKADSG